MVGFRFWEEEASVAQAAHGAWQQRVAKEIIVHPPNLASRAPFIPAMQNGRVAGAVGEVPQSRYKDTVRRLDPFGSARWTQAPPLTPGGLNLSPRARPFTAAPDAVTYGRPSSALPTLKGPLSARTYEILSRGDQNATLPPPTFTPDVRPRPKHLQRFAPLVNPPARSEGAGAVPLGKAELRCVQLTGPRDATCGPVLMMLPIVPDTAPRPGYRSVPRVAHRLCTGPRG